MASGTLSMARERLDMASDALTMAHERLNMARELLPMARGRLRVDAVLSGMAQERDEGQGMDARAKAAAGYAKAQEIIRKAKANRATKLRLALMSLREIPPELWELTQLTELELQYNQLRTVPKELGELKALTTLRLDNNQLTAVPKELGELKALTKLSLSNNQLTAVPKELGELQALTKLHLSDSQLTAVPKELGELKALTELRLFNNQLTAVPKELGELKALTVLSLSYNQLTAVPKELGELKALTELRLDNNQLTTVPKELRELKQLKVLFLHENPALGIPPEVLGPRIEECVGWGGSKDPAKPSEILAYYFGKVGALEEIERKLNELSSTLDWSRARLRSEEREKVERKYLSVRQQELAEEQARLLREQYKLAKQSPERSLNECKLIVVGEPQGGKTRLIGWLITGKDPGPPEYTDGIKIGTWRFDVPGTASDRPEQIRVNVWDFGGQEILRATHTFFLTEKAVYVLVLDARNNQQQRREEHWLERIRTFGKGSKVLLVLNKTDVANYDPDVKQLRESYGDIIVGELHRTSAEKNVGIDALREALKAQILNTDNVRQKVLSPWLDAKDGIEQLTKTKKTISEREYREVCNEHGVKDQLQQDSLLSYLVQLGTLHRYGVQQRATSGNPDDVLVLDPEWVSEGVFGVLTSPVLKQDAGVLDSSKLSQYFRDRPDYPKDKQKFILDALTLDQFELAFRIPDRAQYLVPEALTSQTPTHGIDPLDCRSLNASWKYRYLPRGLISRFTVRQHEAIDRDCGDGTTGLGAWQNGVVLKVQGLRVLVRGAPEQDRVYCTVATDSDTTTSVSPQAILALGVVRSTLESVHRALRLSGVEEYVCAPVDPLEAAKHQKGKIGSDTPKDPWHIVKWEQRSKLEDLLLDKQAGSGHRHKIGETWLTVGEWLDRVSPDASRLGAALRRDEEIGMEPSKRHNAGTYSVKRTTTEKAGNKEMEEVVEMTGEGKLPSKDLSLLATAQHIVSTKDSAHSRNMRTAVLFLGTVICAIMFYFAATFLPDIEGQPNKVQLLGMEMRSSNARLIGAAVGAIFFFSIANLVLTKKGEKTS